MCWIIIILATLYWQLPSICASVCVSVCVLVLCTSVVCIFGFNCFHYSSFTSWASMLLNFILQGQQENILLAAVLLDIMKIMISIPYSVTVCRSCFMGYGRHALLLSAEAMSWVMISTHVLSAETVSWMKHACSVSCDCFMGEACLYCQLWLFHRWSMPVLSAVTVS